MPHPEKRRMGKTNLLMGMGIDKKGRTKMLKPERRENEK